MTTAPDLTATEPAGMGLDLEPVVDTLNARTTGADPAQIRQVVEQVAHQFDNARVRDFLPVLILKAAGDRLRSLGLSRKVVV